MTILGGQVQSILSNDLLTLAQGYIVEVFVVKSEAKFLPQSLHILQWIYSWAEHKEYWSARASLFI